MAENLHHCNLHYTILQSNITYMMEVMKNENNYVPKRKTRKKSLFITIYIWNSALNIQADLMSLFFAVYLKINVI